MNFGFVKVSANNCKVSVADCYINSSEIIKSIKKSFESGVELAVFPELCITGYSCGDLFLQKSLLDDAKDALKKILEETKDLNITVVVGMPIEHLGKLFNCGIAIYKGQILGAVPKTHLPNYSEFYEKRYFSSPLEKTLKIKLLGQEVLFGTKLIFAAKNKEDFKFAIEICEDLWASVPPSSHHSMAGANLIVNLSASNETAEKAKLRKDLVLSQSYRAICGYIYCSASSSESTTDTVFSAHNIVCENGSVVLEKEGFESGISYTELDLAYISNEKRRNTTFFLDLEGYETVEYEMQRTNFEISRVLDKLPFLPKNEEGKTSEKILDIQAYGLKKRMEHIGTKKVIIGISGGLDSTYALLVLNRAYDILGYDKKDIIAVTMPCFGTSERTYKNTKSLCKAIGTTFLEINIKDAVLAHFKDIGQDENKHDITFENSQARERTQILMDMANKHGAIVVGTGDLSELALGFSTYNGDHMSMYCVNCGVPKTLIKYLTNYFAKNEKEPLKTILQDILETPISPELLPPSEKGDIAQVTEDIVGPYELHDFFLFNFLDLGHSPEKIYYLAQLAFKKEYQKEQILSCLKKFYIRFFTQQFKRSCMPDGPKVCAVSLSPRADFKMPSDASFKAFIKRLENL